MNIKIQGGGTGKYSNTGSSYGVVSYLEHEDLQRMSEQKSFEPFFNQEENVLSREVIKEIDQNKAKLSKKDAKFFVITVSPSKEEIKAMGSNDKEQSLNFKELIRHDIMELYAENFNKGLGLKDIKFYAKIHYTRKDDNSLNMHAHIIVSRKDMSNKIKISPQTNHKGNSRGAVKSGFNRVHFYEKSEQLFDVRFDYSRDYQESFSYRNTMKNGTIKEMQDQVSKSFKTQVAQEHKKERSLSKEKGGMEL